MHPGTQREVTSWKRLQLIIVPNALDNWTMNNANYYEEDEDDDADDDEDDDDDDGHDGDDDEDELNIRWR